MVFSGLIFCEKENVSSALLVRPPLVVTVAHYQATVPRVRVKPRHCKQCVVTMASRRPLCGKEGGEKSIQSHIYGHVCAHQSMQLCTAGRRDSWPQATHFLF